MSVLIKDEYTDLLCGVIEKIRFEHEATFQEWMPHEWVPWDLGRNFAFIGGKDFDPQQVELDDLSVAATTILLFHKDQLPSYHRIAAQKFPVGTPVWGWLNRWTAEEAAHAAPLRDYLIVTRATDPEVLERRRLKAVVAGYLQRSDTIELSSVDSLTLVALSERISATLATKISEHTQDYPLQKITEYIANDDFLQANTFISLLKVALDKDFPKVSQAILRQAAAASPLGEDWGEGFPEVDIISEKLYTPQTHRAVVDNFLTDLGLLPNLE